MTWTPWLSCLISTCFISHHTHDKPPTSPNNSHTLLILSCQIFQRSLIQLHRPNNLYDGTPRQTRYTNYTWYFFTIIKQEHSSHMYTAKTFYLININVSFNEQSLPSLKRIFNYTQKHVNLTSLFDNGPALCQQLFDSNILLSSESSIVMPPERTRLVNIGYISWIMISSNMCPCTFHPQIQATGPMH